MQVLQDLLRVSVVVVMGFKCLCVVRQITDERSNRGLLHMADMIEDITYREQSMPMPSSLEARVFLPGLSSHRRRSVASWCCTHIHSLRGKIDSNRFESIHTAES